MITFEKTGLYYADRDDTKRRVRRSRVLTYLREPCEIAEGVTLGDIFAAVDRYRSLKRFIARYSWCPQIEEFHAQAREPSSDDGDDDVFDCLCVSWRAYRSRHKGTSYLELGTDFSAQGYRRLAPGERVDNFGVDFCPVQSLAHLPVVLNDIVRIAEIDRKALRENVLIEGERSFSLLDVLDAIYWEISFHGGPQAKSEMLDKLTGMVEDIKNGVIETEPMDLPED